jgi:hypothetical protein
MHPVFAAKAADPEGAYVRRWCPELARLAVPFIHAPWEAPATVLAAAGVTLGRHYPRRVLADLEGARRASLAAVVDMRRSPAGRRYVLPDGNDALPLPDGRFARAITRIDYRQMAEQVGAGGEGGGTGCRPCAAVPGVPAALPGGQQIQAAWLTEFPCLCVLLT